MRMRQELAGPIVALSKRLEAYRRNPDRQRKLPETFWREASRLAAEYGVCRVHQALRLNYQDLKRRSAAFSRGRAGRRRPAFVEFKVPGRAEAAVLELEDGHGRRLRVRLEDGTKLALAAAALWDCGR